MTTAIRTRCCDNTRSATKKPDEPGLHVGDRKARANRQRGELVDRIATSVPVRKLLFVKALGDTRVPFTQSRPDHRAGVELAAIDPHRAAKTAADIERRLDD